ncbi:MAG: sensor signal transduction histidine kinase [Xanthobacteraceae bacterium]|jgi:PAS domain S-box-containing protein|nr:sensor signal transduction histidine kinase [Xanthobacteraceae bacterium]
MSAPTDDPMNALSPEETLRALARPVLESGGPALLVREDGSVVAANAAARLGAGTRLPLDLANRVARIAATLRADRPPRLERLRLPGQMVAGLVGCSLLSVPGARAVLIAPLGAPPLAELPVARGQSRDAAEPGGHPHPVEVGKAGLIPDTTPEPAMSAEETASTPPSEAPAPREAVPEVPAAHPQAEVPAPEPAAVAPASTAGRARWFWQTDRDGRFRAVDPRLAAALGRDADDLDGSDWTALGAPAAHQAAVSGATFSRMSLRLATLAGDPLCLEIGGVPTRGEGMRGFALAQEQVAEAGTEDPVASPNAVQPATPNSEHAAETVTAAEPDALAEGTEDPQSSVIPGLVPGISISDSASEAEMAGTSPAMTVVGEHTELSTRPEPTSESEASTAPESSAPAEQPSAPTPPPATEQPPVRVVLSIVPSSPNVVPLRAGSDGSGDAARASWAGLSAGERNAFREIARALGARLEGVDDITFPEPPAPPAAATPQPTEPAPVVPLRPTEAAPPVTDISRPEPDLAPEAERPEPTASELLDAALPLAPEAEGFRRLLSEAERPILDRLPLGVVVYRGDQLLYANRALLDWSGHPDAAALEAAGGLAGLFGEAGASDEADGARALTMVKAGGEHIPVEARLMSAPWDGGTAMLYVLRRAGSGFDDRMRGAELALREAEATARELRAILDTATDGVVLIDKDGIILSMNRSAEALFGFESGEIQGESFTLLFAPESRRAAVDYLDGLASNGVASVLNDGREVIGRVREGGLIPLFMTVGRVGEEAGKFCAVLRDITQWKRAEEELTEAKRLAERANLAKSDFLAKISHEIRTPLNAIIGFSEVMMEERFGPIENERYRDYLRDIHASGGHLISLINDLLDLSKIEAGKLDLAFTSVALNEIVQQCMAIMQPQANRERIIIRSSLAADLPPVVADARSMRQIVLNLVSNSIKFSRPGGQVILSTALTESGEVVLRVRDTGIGMSESDIATAMEPFRQLATSGRSGSGGTGLGLPLTKALAEANRASFAIRSALDTGTLVEITFPSTRVLAE